MTAADGDARGSVLILGLPYFGKMLASDLSALGWRAEYAAHPGRSLRGWAALAPRVARADILYLIGSRMDRGAPQEKMLALRRKPVVVHWVGTDVLIASEEHARRNVSLRIAERPVHWCDAPWLVEELREIGVVAEHVSLPIPLGDAPAPPLPARFAVLLYLPVDPFDRGVFDMETMLRLPGAHPDVRFILIPSPAESLPGKLPPNLEARAWVEDMDALYREVSAYARLTAHDGTPFTVVEALARGRHVIFTHAMPGTIHAAGFEAVSAAMGQLAAKHAAGSLALNEDGRRLVLSRFDRTRTLGELDERLRVLRAAARR